MGYDGIFEFAIAIVFIIITGLVGYIMWTSVPPQTNMCYPYEFSKLERSVITIESFTIPFVNINDEIVDSNGNRYTIFDSTNKYKKYDGHNVTFGYDCIGGRKVITGIFMDDDKTFVAFGYNNETKKFMHCDYKIDLRWDVNKTCEDYNDITNITYGT
jgi:hypothetical protein